MADYELAFPQCFEEFDINQSGTLSNQDGIEFYQMGREDIQLQIVELTLLGNLTDEQISAAGGYCPNGYDGINYEIFRDDTVEEEDPDGDDIEDDADAEISTTPFCQAYSCNLVDFFSIDKFSLDTGYTFRMNPSTADGEVREGSMTYYVGFGWYSGNDAFLGYDLLEGHGIPIDANEDGIDDVEVYDLSIATTDVVDNQEFCHSGLGCTGFGNGTGITIPHADFGTGNFPLIQIPIPIEINDSSGEPIYSEEQYEYYDEDVFGGDPPEPEDDGGDGSEECFVAGTKVKMSNGLEKNIEDIQIGEEVLSYNIHTKKLELKKVTKLFTQVHDLVDGDITVKTKFNNGVETHNTIANPFWSKDKGFVAADAERCNTLHQWVKKTNNGKDTEQLKVGDTLYHYNDKELQEVMVTEIEHILEPNIRTYDITTEDNHTFFANGILTHNSSGGGDTVTDCKNPYAYNYNPEANFGDSSMCRFWSCDKDYGGGIYAMNYDARCDADYGVGVDYDSNGDGIIDAYNTGNAGGRGDLCRNIATETFVCNNVNCFGLKPIGATVYAGEDACRYGLRACDDPLAANCDPYCPECIDLQTGEPYCGPDSFYPCVGDDDFIPGGQCYSAGIFGDGYELCEYAEGVGCTDPAADNYDPEATIECDGLNLSCYDGDFPNCCCEYSAPDDDEIIKRCCLPNTQYGTVDDFFRFEDLPTNDGNGTIFIGDSPSNIGNVYNLTACNQIDCANQGDGFFYIHSNQECISAMGEYGAFGHNVVYNFYTGNGEIYEEEDNDSHKHYPFLNYEYADSSVGEQSENFSEDDSKYFDPPLLYLNEEGDLLFYTADILYDEDSPEYETGGIFNPVFDRWQIGIDKDGNELYNLPIYQSISCGEIESQGGLSADAYEGSLLDYELVNGFVKSPFHPYWDGDITYPASSSYVKGIDYCGGEFLISTAIERIFTDNDAVTIIRELFLFYGETIIMGASGFRDNEDIPSAVNTFGLGKNQLNIEYDNLTSLTYLNSIFPSDSGDYKPAKEILTRLGMPLPPVAVFGSENSLCDGVVESYLQLIDEFLPFLEDQIEYFFGDFQIPNVDIEPTMKSQLDVLSGIDLREENLNACDYIEFMTLPGGNADGDGIYYTTNDIPSIYFESPYDGNMGDIDDGSMTKEQYVRTFDCNTEFNNDIQFSKIRAVCKDGSSVEMAYAGSSGNTQNTIHHDTTDEFFNTGVEACNSQLKLNSNQDLYFLADGDEREALGIFFFENINRGNENFVNTKSSEFDQYNLQNGVYNGGGKTVTSIIGDTAFTDNGWDNPYYAEGWTLINSPVDNSVGDFSAVNASAPYVSTRMAPYWSLNNEECLSYSKCIVVDTLTPNTDDAVEYDSRQGISTFVQKENLSEQVHRQKHQFKFSFMMKTLDIDDGVDLKDTGVHVILMFDNDPIGDGEFNFNWQGIGINPYKNSQCSPNSHPNGLSGEHYTDTMYDNYPFTTLIHGDAYPDLNKYYLNMADYCSKTRASFTSNQIGEWEKMEFVIETDKINNLMFNQGIKIIIAPLQLATKDIRYLSAQSTGNLPWNPDDDQPYVGAFYLDEVLNSKGSAKILIDEVKFRESFDFHPDIDVRKKKASNEYGSVSLTEYYDRFSLHANDDEFNDTTAPLEVQFYFYPRFAFDDVLATNRQVLVEQFKFGQFFITDIDWGDGSPTEFSSQPAKIKPNFAVYHTYEQSGIYEIKGTMFRIVAEDYIHSFRPQDVKYSGNLGVGFSQNFSIKISINEGPDEDFRYFGSDGFSFIPFKETTPIVGGYSKESIYYKSLKRNLGVVAEDKDNNTVTLVDVNYSQVSDRLKAESAFQKMDNSYLDSGALETLKIYQTPIQNVLNTTTEFLQTLPFPKYYDEFKILDVEFITDQENIDEWVSSGRPDLASFLAAYGDGTLPYGQDISKQNETGIYNPATTFINPTISYINEQYTGNQYGSIREGLGESVGDFDVANPKFLNNTSSMYEILGFTDESVDNPSRSSYWKKIIDKEISIFDREGIELLDDGTYAMPQIDIEETYGGAINQQEWIDEDLYRYPILPRHGNDGRYLENDYPYGRQPSPLIADIYNENQSNENLLVNISSEEIEPNVLNDNSGNNNKGFVISDYKPAFDSEKFNINKTKKFNTLKKTKKNRAF